MTDRRAEIVYVDVDDTLIRSAGSKRIPMTSVAERVATLKRAGATPRFCSTTRRRLNGASAATFTPSM
jgi:hypothetical protein